MAKSKRAAWHLCGLGKTPLYFLYCEVLRKNRGVCSCSAVWWQGTKIQFTMFHLCHIAAFHWSSLLEASGAYTTFVHRGHQNEQKKKALFSCFLQSPHLMGLMQLLFQSLIIVHKHLPTTWVHKYSTSCSRKKNKTGYIKFTNKGEQKQLTC